MIRTFEGIALVTAGGLVSGLVALAILNPPQAATARPQAVLEAQKNVQAVAVVPERKASAKTMRFLPIKARGSETLLASVNVRALQDHNSAPLNSAENLDKTFADLGYDLERVSKGHARVPRVFLASMPEDIGDVREVRRKKALFIKTVLPLILQVNDEIRDERARLLDLQSRRLNGEKLAAVDRLWLLAMAERYKVKRGNLKELIKRVDIIPVSLALAQAAEESGWGSSRFTREGNAMFGQWTTKQAKGIIPAKRDAGKTHKIKVFESLLHSARAYAINLNTHRAYRELRTVRKKLRRLGEPVQGRRLVETLTAYSERGQDYVKTIRAIMAVNKLKQFESAELNTGA